MTFREHVRIAADIGGTFTDLQVLCEATGATAAHKTPTTPGDPSDGLFRGIREAADRLGFGLDRVSALIHGTTIATNAVLERKLPRGALLTTAGFEDVLEIGRHIRRDVYSSKAEERALLVPRHRRLGVAERMTAAGTPEVPLDAADVDRLAGRLGELGVEAVAIALLHSYANPAHEIELARLLAERLPGVAISRSSRISPEIREFERTSTTVLNALLMPVVGRYLERLKARMAAEGFRAPVYLVQSNGGVALPDLAAEQPARLLLSGPSGGALAVETLAAATGIANLVGIDMGGTSFDVCVVGEGRAREVTQGEVDGLPVRLPMIEIRTIGAGGGSLARVEAGTALRVGPESAGAEPGPACYRRGGERPTVTDANVATGRLDPGYFLGGAMTLDVEAAATAIATHVADPLAMQTSIAADGILAIANTRMAQAIRLSLFEKGLDPKDFALVSFGGAGGMHAVPVAQELGAEAVLFPRDPGTLSAWGMLFADLVHDLARSQLVPATPAAVPGLAAAVADLTAEAERLLERDGVPAERRRLQLLLDLRYPGQAYEIVVPAAVPLDGTALARAVGDFHDLHQAQYAHAERDAVPEVVTVRLRATGLLSKPAARPPEAAAGRDETRRRRMYVDGRWDDVPVLRREHLAPETSIAGPAVIEEAHSTILLPRGWTARVRSDGHLEARPSP